MASLSAMEVSSLELGTWAPQSRYRGCYPALHLGGQDDAHVAQVDVDRPQVLPVAGAAGQHRDLGQVLQRLPLSADVVHLQGCKRLIDKVVQSWRRPILEPSPG